MINNIKLIRARLSRNGVKGVSNLVIKEAILKHNDGEQEFTEEQKDAVVNELLQVYNNNNVSIEKADLELGDGENNSEEINHEHLTLLPKLEPASLTTYEEKVEMVAHQAQEMGVVLSANDIQQISETISGQTTDADEINAEIRTAISAYIQFHKAQSLNKVSTLVRDVYREQSEANREISEALSEGLQQFSRDMEVSRQHTKSSVRNALQCFAIPSTEAQR